MSRLEAAAATRDAGMVASSLVRHGAPIQEFPDLEEFLVTLSIMTDEVPADTVISYGPRNPYNGRMRTFTGESGEQLFISCVIEGMRSLPTAVAALDAAQEFSPTDSEFSCLVDLAASNFSAMIVSITQVSKCITPEYFTHKLRPYFEPKIIGGKTYLAPGGAQMPVILIDLALWGGRDNNPQYIRYWNENVSYLPLSLRVRTQKIVRSEPLIDKVAKELENVKSFGVSQRENVELALGSIDKLIVMLQKFRYPHLRIAEENMAIRQKGAVGSGGYDTEVLKLLIASSESARKKVQKLQQDLKEN
ncbi:MAG: monodechloroaminopyrrolnitrin synthase PrnB family protein [Patescibacteria group bacterium]